MTSSMTSQEIYSLLKLSIFSYLVNKDIPFCNKGREVIFDTSTNDNKISIQNKIVISQNNSLSFISYLAIRNEFLENKELSLIANYLNEISNFSCYIQDLEVNRENVSLFCIKAPIFVKENVPIDEEFWEEQIYLHNNNISAFTDFLFFKFPESKFFQKKEEISSLEFKNFFIKELKSYIDAVKIIEQAQINKEYDYSDWTKEEVDKEIDKELEKFSKGDKNIYKLNMLVKALRKKEAN